MTASGGNVYWKLARERPRFGYRRLHLQLGRDAIEVNHKKVNHKKVNHNKVQRVYRELGLTVKRTLRKRGSPRTRPLVREVEAAEARATAASLADRAGQEWPTDLASGVTAGSQRIRVLSVLTASPNRVSRSWGHEQGRSARGGGATGGKAESGHSSSLSRDIAQV